MAGRLLGFTSRIEDGLLVVMMAAMIVLALAQIVLRNLFSTGWVWADPLLRNLVLWVGLIGATAATREDRQITVDVLSRLLSERVRAGARVVTDLFTAGVSGLVAWHIALRYLLLAGQHFRIAISPADPTGTDAPASDGTTNGEAA